MREAKRGETLFINTLTELVKNINKIMMVRASLQLYSMLPGVVSSDSRSRGGLGRARSNSQRGVAERAGARASHQQPEAFTYSIASAKRTSSKEQRRASEPTIVR